MSPFFLVSTLFFLVLRIIALVLHYYGPSPYGGVLVVDPIRFIFNAIFIEAGVILFFSFLFQMAAILAKNKFVWVHMGWAVFMGAYSFFCQFDLEIVRWMGQHVNISYLSNYLGKSDPNMLKKILSTDIIPTGSAVLLGALAISFSLWLIFSRKIKNYGKIPTLKWQGVLIVFTLVLCSSPLWFMQSDKRWRRIKPVVVGLTQEVFSNLLDLEAPRNPKRAYADLVSYIHTGRLSEGEPQPVAKYPFLNEGYFAGYNPEEFKKLPREDRPNIIYIMYETWKTWKTNLTGDSNTVSYTPLMDSLLENEGYIFPWSHSIGFPSVEGAIGVHLASWPHFRKIFISDYLAINSISLPEIFRDVGYRTEIYIGADPSFSNLNHWFSRWYDYFEYSKKYDHDGPLTDRFIQALDTIDRQRPFFLTTWTVTTHPPYTLPASEGISAHDDKSDRYNQAITYADKHVFKVIDWLKKSDLWNNSIVLLVGDHSQPENSQRNNPEIGGAFTPGHTWTPIAILGGWKGVPSPKVNPETVSQMDVAPTILEMVKLKVPNHFMGKSLLNPQSREQLTFRWGDVAKISETDRLLFNTDSKEILYIPVDKNSDLNYGLFEGHTMPKSKQPPYEFDMERYIDMIWAYAELLDQNRLFPEVTTRKKGVYNYIP
jgi:hypothetical protein